MIKKLLTVLLCFVLLLTVASCGYGVSQPTFDESAKNGIPSDPLIAENDKYRLELNTDNMGIILVDKSTGQRFSSTPDSSSGEKFDELGMPIKKHPQVESIILVEYLNQATNIEDTLISYTGAVQNGRVRCGKTENGLRVEFYFDDADIMIPVDYSLNEMGATISIDPKAIQEGENKVHTVSIAPFWCSAENDSDNSYLFVPSGSGALIEPETRSQQGDTYSARVYGEDYSIEKKVSIAKTEEVKLPVYGAKMGNNAICAIIEEGAETAWINVNAGSSTIGFSGVYSTFQLRGYTDHTAKLFSKTEIDNVVYSKLMISSPVSVTFCPLSEENADYSGMASLYREYLKTNHGLTETEKEVLLNLDLIGGASVTRSFLGIPYKTTLATTSLSDALDIVNGLSSKLNNSFSVNLKGYGSDGIDIGKLGGGFELNDNLGSKKELQGLISACDKNNVELYMNYDIIRFSESGNGFSKNFDTVTNAGEQKATQYHYDIAVRNQTESTIHYLLNPDKLTDAAEKLLKMTDNLGVTGISLDTISYMSYSDYSDKSNSRFYSKSGMTDISAKVISKIKANNRFLATDANAYAAVAANLITCAPTESSGEYIFKCDVPFYQMVFKGYIPLVIDSINLADDPDKLILKAVEGGCGLNYTAISEWDNSLIDSPYRVFFGSTYSDIEASIVDTVKGLEGYLESVSGAYITSHEILSSTLRRTVFSNGVTVYVNYGNTAAYTVYGEIAPNDYLVLEGRE